MTKETLSVDPKITAIADPLTRELLKNAASKAWSSFWREKYPWEIPTSIELHSDFRPLLEEQSRVLDIGCGGGRISKDLVNSGHRVCGVDLMVDALTQVDRQRDGFSYMQANALFLPFHKEQFDAALLLGVLSLIEQEGRVKALREAVRVTKPGRPVYVSDFERIEDDPVWEKVYNIDRQYTREYGSVAVVDWEVRAVRFFTHHFTRQELELLLVNSGLTRITIREQNIVSALSRRPYKSLCVWGFKQS